MEHGFAGPPEDRRRFLAGLLEHPESGRIKLHVIRAALQARRERPAPFGSRAYHPLAPEGPAAVHVVAFARGEPGSGCLVAVVPRLTGGMSDGVPPVQPSLWAGTRLRLPDGWPAHWVCALSGETLDAAGGALALDEVLQRLPAALLLDRPVRSEDAMGLTPVKAGSKITLRDEDARLPGDGTPEKQELNRRLAGLTDRLDALQAALFAEGKRSVLVVLQGRDGAGKDGAIRGVFGPLDPQGVAVTSFKAPTSEELAHDYLWRVHRAVRHEGPWGSSTAPTTRTCWWFGSTRLVPEAVWRAGTSRSTPSSGSWPRTA